MNRTALIPLVLMAFVCASCAHTPAHANTYQEECDGAGEPESCIKLGRMYAEGEGGVRQDWAQAAARFKRACDAGFVKGCVDLGVEYENGEGVEQSWETAARLFQQACDGGAPGGCNNLGNLYAKGKGVRKDPVQANRLYQQACKAGVEIGCYNAGTQGNAAAPSTTTSSTGVAPSSSTGSSETNTNNFETKGSAAIYVNNKLVSTSGSSPDSRSLQDLQQLAKEMTTMAQKFCQEKGAGCYRLDSTVTTPGNVTVYVNGQRVNGEGIQLGINRMRSLLDKECSDGNAAECYALSIMYQNGNGAPKDPDQAQQLRRKACSGGIQAACDGSH
jgi:uncharacterized protein